MHILPITTMNAYDDPLPDWNAVHLGIVTADLERIRWYLNAGWAVFGWQNQNSAGTPGAPYAVGGGVAAVPAQVADVIQRTLLGYAADYS